MTWIKEVPLLADFSNDKVLSFPYSTTSLNQYNGGRFVIFFSVFSFGYLGGNVYICSDIVTC
jgi:hypothetical protein